MSDLEKAINQHRAMLELAGIRGLDLDYLLDPRVDHAACYPNFEKMVHGPFERWLVVWSNNSEDEWANLEVLDNSHPKMVALRRASRELKNFFAGHVLTFYKDMVRRVNEERKAKAGAEGDDE